MKTLYKSLPKAFGMLGFLALCSFAVQAQDAKPELPFNVILDETEENLAIEWNACLENSHLFVLDASGNTLDNKRLCESNAALDFAAFEPGVYTLRIEHYTGVGERRVVKHLDGNLSYLDINPDKAKLEFSLYPNPAQNQVTIDSKVCLENSILMVQDMQGRVVRHISLCKDGYTLDISNLPQGMYFIKIEHYTGVGVQRLVKQ